LREKERKRQVSGKSEKKKKDSAFACPHVELSSFMLSNTAYQRIELT